MPGRRAIVTYETLKEFEQQFNNLSQRRAILECERRSLKEKLTGANQAERSPVHVNILERLEGMKKTLREAKARLNKVATKLNKMENPDKIAIGASAKEVQRWLDEIDAMLLEESKAQDDIEKQRE